MFASEFGDEGRVVIVVGDDVDDDIDKDDWCVAMVYEWGAKARVLDEATVLKKQQDMRSPCRASHSIRMRTIPYDVVVCVVR